MCAASMLTSFFFGSGHLENWSVEVSLHSHWFGSLVVRCRSGLHSFDLLFCVPNSFLQVNPTFDVSHLTSVYL